MGNETPNEGVLNTIQKENTMKLSFIFMLLALLLVIGCEEMAVDPGTIPSTSSSSSLEEADSTWQEPGINQEPGTNPEPGTNQEPGTNPEPGTIPSGRHIELSFEEDNNGTINVNVGDSLTVALETNGSTGYHWVDYSEQEVQTWKSSQTVCPQTDLIGVSCTAIYSWKVSEIDGPKIISMGYEPPGGMFVQIHPDGTISESQEIKKFTLTVNPN